MAWIFWISVSVIFYTYIGYPAGIWLLSRIRRRTRITGGEPKTVSVLIACHNESGAIASRIENILDSNYPAELLEVIVASDGSTDGTVEQAERFSSARVRVAGYPARAGKATALNLGAGMARGKIIVFADARQSFAPDAITKLVASFADPKVGAVSGELILRAGSSSTVGEGAGFYWKFEKWIRKSESAFDSCVGATGAIYAIRRELWRDLPAGTILDDVYSPMQIAKAGYRVVFEEAAKAYDCPAPSAAREFNRKVRTLLGNYQLCQLMPGLLNPAARLGLQFYSHKLLRLAAPVFLVLMLLSNAVLCTAAASAGSALIYTVVMSAQIFFYLSVIAGWALSGREGKSRVLNAAYVFSVMNAAAVVGLIYFISGKRDVWVSGK